MIRSFKLVCSTIMPLTPKGRKNLKSLLDRETTMKTMRTKKIKRVRFLMTIS